MPHMGHFCFGSVCYTFVNVLILEFETLDGHIPYDVFQYLAK